MAVEYLKKALKTATADQEDVSRNVADILRQIEEGGEAIARDFGRRFDKWEGDLLLSASQRSAAGARLPERVKADIAFAHEQVKAFAEAQLDSIGEFRTELCDGLTAGQKLVPMTAAGCYVPGGRYAHVASAIMSVTTAKVAGVERIVACSPPRDEQGIDPAIVYALDLCGADDIICMGGVQAIASMAFGYFTGAPADILVGPGNQYVAEAKRLLYGRVGIDMFAGPTEIAIIADDTADPDIVACDLVGQAEHGYNSPAWLISLSREVAEDTIQRIDGHIAALPELNAKNARAAWRDYGEVVLAQDREQAARLSDDYAAEHLEVHAADLDWWLGRLRNYGSLFLGEETTVAFGDKTSGPNHILPTKGAARYSGGLSVHKFLKILTWQRMSREANRDVAAVTARISRLEGMEGHARTGDVRLAKYFPDEDFQLSP